MTTTTATVAPPALPAGRGRPGGQASLVDALRSEWAKLTTVRSTWITLVVSVLVGVGLGAWVSYLQGHHYANLSPASKAGTAWHPATISLDTLGLAQLAIAVLGVLFVTSEYGTGMIRTSLAAVPRRGRFLAAKAIVFTAVTLVVGEVMAFAAFLIGQQMIIVAHAPHAGLGSPGVLRAVFGAGLYLALIGLLGAGFGFILRRTAAGISAMVALLFVLPAIVQALPQSWAQAITKWWPTQAGGQVIQVTQQAHALSPWGGLGVLAGFTAIVVWGGFELLRRRDA